MAKLLLNANGKVLMKDSKVYKAPEVENPLQALITGKGANAGKYLFQEYQGDNVDFITDIDWSANTTCQYMFQQCINLQTIPLFDTSNVTNMQSMFNVCEKLQTISLLNTSKVTTMSSMFSNCFIIENIPQLNTNNVNNMANTFLACRELKVIDLTSIDKWSSTSSSMQIFANCFSLKKIIIREMTVVPPLHSTAFANASFYKGYVSSQYNPDGLRDGRIYVPDDMVETLKSATNWSEYADLIVPLSTLEE